MNIQALLIALAVTAVVIGAYIWLAPKPEPVGVDDPRQPHIINVHDVFAKPAPKVLFATLKLGVVELQKSSLRLEAHYRENSHEFLLMVGGEGVGFIGDRVVRAHAGQLLVVPAGTAVALQKRSDQDMQFITFITPPTVGRDYHSLQIGDDYPFGDPSAVAPKSAAAKTVRDNVNSGAIELTEAFAKNLNQEGPGFKLGILASARSGSVVLAQIDESVAAHRHNKNSEFVYVFKGQGTGKIGDQTAELSPGQLIYMPSGTPHQLTKTGNEPLQLVLFSVPGFDPKDIEWLEGK
jgi:mannose-6-phosphate isomerase-like protein (cupin superfamily)